MTSDSHQTITGWTIETGVIEEALSLATSVNERNQLKDVLSESPTSGMETYSPASAIAATTARQKNGMTKWDVHSLIPAVFFSTGDYQVEGVLNEVNVIFVVDSGDSVKLIRKGVWERVNTI